MNTDDQTFIKLLGVFNKCLQELQRSNKFNEAIIEEFLDKPIEELYKNLTSF